VALGGEGQPLGAAVGTRLLGDEAVALERAQQASEVAGIQAEPGADVARRGPVRADLEQNA
jgi:hypothetical protein